MKKNHLFYILTAIIFFSCTKNKCEVCTDCTPTDSCKIDLNKGLLAYYPFNGNANDVSGKGNNGVFMNEANVTTDHLGRPAKAAGFDGINDYLIVTDSGKLNSDTLTISLLLLSNDVNRLYGIISKQDYNSAKGYQFGVSQSEINNSKISFAVAPPDDCNTVQLYDASIATRSIQSFTNGRWYHVMVTFAGNQQKMYVDGVLMSTITRSFTSMKKCTNSQLIIGNWWKGAPYPLDGKIDEVRMYSRLLNSCEVDELNSMYN